MGKQMEGDNKERRKKAKEARERGNLASEENVTMGASKQRQKADANDEYPQTLENIRDGKHKVIRENTPEPKPGYVRESEQDS
jgi:hypothetical protein